VRARIREAGSLPRRFAHRFRIIRRVTTALLYFVASAAAAWLIHRHVTTLSRRAAAILILLPLLFTGPALLTGRVYAPIDLPYLTNPLKAHRAEHGITNFGNGMLSDVYSLNIPWKYAARVALQQREWPLWNPYSFCGDILAASAQPTPYEPFFLLSLLLPMANSLTFMAAITFFLAGLLMFAFLRELRCSETAALVGSLSWMYATFVVFWLEWVIAPTTIWLPLVLLAVRRLVRERSLRAAVILTVAFVMMLLNGHPESALHIVTVGILWALVELAVLRFRGFVRATLLALGAGIVALMLTAIYMLPIVEAIPQTAEQNHRIDIYAKQDRSVPWNVALQRLRLHFVPFVYGAPHREWPTDPPNNPFSENSSAGSVVLALALFGLWRAKTRARWLALAMIVIGIPLGCEMAPFANWIAKLPLFNIALNSRFAAMAAFGFVMLAAFGVDRLREEREALRFAIVAIVTASFLSILVVQSWPAMTALPLSVPYLRAATLILLLPLAGAVLAALTLRRHFVLFTCAIAILIGAQRRLELGDFYPTLDASAFYPKLDILDALPESDDPYRVTSFGFAMIPNSATLYRLEDVRGYQAMTLSLIHSSQPYWSVPQPVWFNRVESPSGFLSMMNVRFAMAEEGYPLPAGWRLVAAKPGVQLFENPGALPRAFIPQSVAIAPDPVASWGERILRLDDYRKWSFVEVEGQQPHTIENGRGDVSIRRDGMRAFNLQASVDAPTWIVISQSGWKGWRAYVDGKPTKVRHANLAVIGIWVERGRHDIHLEYLPHSFVLGRAITFTTMLAIAIACVIARKRMRAIRKS
jgi:hypothetical protein